MVAAGSITVAVRVRPPTSWEAARLPEPVYDTTIRGDGILSAPARPVSTGCLRDIVQVVDDRILTFDPDEKDKAKSFVERGFLPPGTKRYKDKRFMFDRVFDHGASQQGVYEATAQPLLKGLLEGYNATVFAYGATGCGKTHTISGTDADPGIIYLTMADLFQRIDDRREEWNVEVLVTFLEIYNEEIRDLLAEPGSATGRGGLSIREDKVVKVVGLVEHKPKTAEEVKEIVLLGNSRRTQSPTHANETSSRSHAVLQVHVTQAPHTASITEQRTMATLSIIDLAGSERAAATTNMGQRMVEGANINKSLLALGNCINALCESGGATRHIPYRNSKLTRLLKFSLGGNCKTVMIVCVAPTSNHFDDTHNTLIYAERATKIRTKVVTRNVVNVDRHVGRYVEAINRLNDEVAELKAKLAGKRTSETDIVQRKKKEALAEVERAKSDITVKVEQTKAAIIDGATCTGKLSVANMRLAAIRARLAQIDSQGNLGAVPLPGDLEAERALLKALAGPEEEAIRPGSTLNTRLSRSSNSSAMFDATLRAVSERRSDKLEDIHVDFVKLDARCRKAEIERLKAESERDVLRDNVRDMAEVMVKLVGMLGRCTVLVGNAAKSLKDTDGDGSAQTVASFLDSLKQKNDEAFTSLLGHSTAGYNIAPLPTGPSPLDVFSSFETSFNRRVSSGPAVLQQVNTAKSRRQSSAAAASPPRRAHKSPRKSLRSSLSQPYRRVSDKDKKGLKSAKNVQWRDEAGQGELDDAGPKPIVTVIPASPDVILEPSTSSSSVDGSYPPRSASVLGSESEWEDEKTDDSISISAGNPSLPQLFRDPSSSSSSSARPYGSLGTKRARPSRLDPSFLKAKSTMSSLGSLAETDENTSLSHIPLSDMSLNVQDDSGSGGDGERKMKRTLLVPKDRLRGSGSPSRRGPPSPTRAGGGSSSSSAGPSSRRRSTIGPLRNEKGRRRSSLIPQLSPSAMEGRSATTRRVMLASPGKRVKRVSLSKSTAGASRVRAPTPSFSVGLGNLSVLSADPGDTSFTRGASSRPTWR
ncbi:kinesin-like protein [Pluteus cervinus]|uniref:Kinesin-like protein n=1 Tax=Pluteus cervinus TaxID=181527 RepID=A0ACD3B9W5_9AGAR|nr:kinesin-like protein [Pluteus cervinus]